MSEREKQIAETLSKAFDILPDDNKEFLIGYGEGVAAMAAIQSAQRQDENPQRRGRDTMGKTTAPPIAYCRLHKRMMNFVYMRRRKCLERLCHHIEWIDGQQQIRGKTEENHEKQTHHELGSSPDHHGYSNGSAHPGLSSGTNPATD